MMKKIVGIALTIIVVVSLTLFPMHCTVDTVYAGHDCGDQGGGKGHGDHGNGNGNGHGDHGNGNGNGHGGGDGGNNGGGDDGGNAGGGIGGDIGGSSTGGSSDGNGDYSEYSVCFDNPDGTQSCWK